MSLVDTMCRMIFGPCTVETLEQLLATARAIKRLGIRELRAGAYKPRTQHTSFQGLGVEGLKLLAEVKAMTGVQVVTELLDVRDLERVLAVADTIVVGARNSQNYPMLTELGNTRCPVIIKRGAGMTLGELLGSAGYVTSGGNRQVTLCERGIRGIDETVENKPRYALDLGAVAWLKAETDHPVIVDPSHAAGRADLVLPLARAAVAAGADGLIVECHPNPAEAWCDGPQQIPTAALPEFVAQVRAVATAFRPSLAEAA